MFEAAHARIDVQLTKREQPDLMLFGVMMPVLDGWQAAYEIDEARETSAIEIVFPTARSSLQRL